MIVDLTIDPGITGTGLAIWDHADWDKLVPPIWAGNFTPKDKSTHWQFKTQSIMSQIEDRLLELNVMEINVRGNRFTSIDMVYSEIPKDFDSAIGQAAAKTGNIVKLAAHVGYMLAHFHQWGIPVQYIDVNDHLGQLPKEIVEKRIKKLFPNLEVSDHAVDATSVGIYAKGYRLDGNKRV